MTDEKKSLQQWNKERIALSRIDPTAARTLKPPVTASRLEIESIKEPVQDDPEVVLP